MFKYLSLLLNHDDLYVLTTKQTRLVKICDNSIQNICQLNLQTKLLITIKGIN